MDRLSEIQARIQSLGDLGGVIAAMRSLAAVRVQQAHAALPAIRRYSGVINGALARAFALGPRSREPSIAPAADRGSVTIAFSSEQGFVGAFNEHVLDAAAVELSAPGDRLIVVGSRGAALAVERKLPVAWTIPMATHGDVVAQVARRVADEVSRRASGGELRCVTLLYARTSSESASKVVVTTLLPFDPTPYLAAGAGARTPPLTNLTPDALIDQLVDELVFAELMHGAMESFASENGARLATMEAARANIDKKLDDLAQDERQRRQDEITTELLDVVTGAEAVAANG